MSNRTSKAFKGTITSFFQYGLTIILQLLLAPLVLKIAGQEVLGAYSIVMQMVGYGILLDLGFSVALSRYLSQSFGFPDKGDRFIEIFNIGRLFLLFTNFVFALFIFIVAWRIGDLIAASEAVTDQARYALCFLAIWTIVRTPLAMYNHGLIATQNMAAANIISTIGNMGRLFFSLGLIYAGLGLMGLIAANIISEGLQFMLQMKYFRKKYIEYVFSWKVTDGILFKEIISFGVKYWGVNLSVVLFLGSDSIVVGHLYGASAASVFYTTKIPAFLLMQFIFRLSDSAAPGTNELFAQKNYEALRTVYLKILRYSLLLSLPVAIGVIGFGKEVITVWVGAGQFAGRVMSYALAAFVLTQVINHINAMITLAAGDMRRWSEVSIVTSVLSLFLSYWMGQFFGMQWVMVSIALMDIPNVIFLFKRSLNGLKLSLICVWRESLVPALLSCLPLCGMVYYLKSVNFIFTFIGLVASVSLYSVLWAVSVLILGVSRSEKSILKNKLKSTFFYA